MKNKNRGRILVVDDEPDVRSDLQDILEPLNFTVIVAEGKGDRLIEHAETLASQFWPHVVIIDLRLYLSELEDDRSGLILVSRFRSAQCILYSNFLKTDISLDANRVGAFAWVNKADSPQKLVDEIELAIRQNSAYEKGVSIKLPNNWSRSHILKTLSLSYDESVSSTLVDDFLCQLFPKSKRIVAENIHGRVVTPHEASRGRSIVLKVFPDDLIPVVVKLGSSIRIKKEQSNYEKYVEQRLEGGFYAHLMNAKRFWELGGTVYSFVGSPLRGLSSFTDFYRQTRKPETILRPLQHFFGEVWSRHYRNASPTKVDTLFQLYNTPLKLEERLQEIKTPEKTRSFPDLPKVFINPANWVLDHWAESPVRDVREAVTHGDLHGDNLFADENHAWAIDFERTENNHILRDFLELETDIVTRIALPELGAAQFYPLAVALLSMSDPKDTIPLIEHAKEMESMAKTIQVVNQLRQLAYDVTRYINMQEYYWGLLFDTLFIASYVSQKSLQRERALLLASLICERLRHWGQSWPPKPNHE